MPKLLPLAFTLLAIAAGAVCVPACGANPEQLIKEIRARLSPGQKTKVTKPKAKARPQAKKPSAPPQAEETAAKPASPQLVPLKKVPLGPVPSLALEAQFTSSYDEAVADAQKSNRKILLILTGEHCNPCHDMRDHVFPQPQVRKALGAYVVLALVPPSLPPLPPMPRQNGRYLEWAALMLRVFKIDPLRCSCGGRPPAFSPNAGALA